MTTPKTNRQTERVCKHDRRWRLQKNSDWAQTAHLFSFWPLCSRRCLGYDISFLTDSCGNLVLAKVHHTSKGSLGLFVISRSPSTPKTYGTTSILLLKLTEPANLFELEARRRAAGQETSKTYVMCSSQKRVILTLAHFGWPFLFFGPERIASFKSRVCDGNWNRC